MNRLHYTEALRRTGLLARLAQFDPHVAGTPPLGLDLLTSDIDVLCEVFDPQEFMRVVWDAYAACEGFAVWQSIGMDRPIIASFIAYGWTFELFGQAQPVFEQDGWRHLTAERRLLAIGGKALRTAVMNLRRSGAKTEPAFAAALGLSGDPYQALLDIACWSDEALGALLDERGF